MLINTESMLENMLKDELKTSHLENKVTISVTPVEKLTQRAKDAITKLKGAKFLKSCDYIIGCVAPEENPPEEDDVEQTEEPVEQNDQGGEDEEKQALNENIKVEDLTKQMLQPIKTPKIPGSSTSSKKCVKEAEGESKKRKQSKAKKVTPVPCPIEKPEEEEEKGGEDAGAAPSVEAGGEAVGGVEEAETQATGDELRGKVAKAVERVFKTQETESNKLELFDLPDVQSTAKTYFAAITIQEKPGQIKT